MPSLPSLLALRVMKQKLVDLFQLCFFFWKTRLLSLKPPQLSLVQQHTRHTGASPSWQLMPDDKRWLTMRIDTAALLGLKQPHSSKLKSRMTLALLLKRRMVRMLAHSIADDFVSYWCLVVNWLDLFITSQPERFPRKDHIGCSGLRREDNYNLNSQLGQIHVACGVLVQLPLDWKTSHSRTKRRKILDGHHLDPKLHSAANLSTAHVVNRVFYLILSKKLV
ncbi:hypothetical protein PGT21_004496 [Puccinia graminis f. sp. tritici]|uniref:Uncharacterized protein n=1 Tax=Puccinia graminis f. sp. tritici TaxID=56615 RepID=A0A5B0PEZ4_PUCGR|nr:hypothetical protein PGTUg99_009913 [Puccinia graminis f. sp. tritici]KAA1099352.1 hypothetical protein PGT21_004496 [Puccinia graminis f. sp. tritici]